MNTYSEHVAWAATVARRTNRVLAGLLFVSVIVNILSIGLAHRMWGYKPDDKVLALTADYRVLELPTLSTEYFDQRHVMQWAERNAARLYDVSWNTIDKAWPNQLSEIATEEAKGLFMKALASVGLIRRIQDEGLHVSASVETPLFKGQGSRVINGEEIVYWVYDIPARIHYMKGDRGSAAAQQKVVLQITVIRAHFHVRRDGLEMARIVIKPA